MTAAATMAVSYTTNITDNFSNYLLQDNYDYKVRALVLLTVFLFHVCIDKVVSTMP